METSSVSATLPVWVEVLKIAADVLKAAFWPGVVYLTLRVVAPDLPRMIARVLKMKLGAGGVEFELKEDLKEAIEQVAVSETLSPPKPEDSEDPRSLEERSRPGPEMEISIDTWPEFEAARAMSMRSIVIAIFDCILFDLRNEFKRYDSRALEYPPVMLIHRARRSGVLTPSEEDALRVLLRMRYDPELPMSDSEYLRVRWLSAHLDQRVERRVNSAIRQGGRAQDVGDNIEPPDDDHSQNNEDMS